MDESELSDFEHSKEYILGKYDKIVTFIQRRRQDTHDFFIETNNLTKTKGHTLGNMTQIRQYIKEIQQGLKEKTNDNLQEDRAIIQEDAIKNPQLFLRLDEIKRSIKRFLMDISESMQQQFENQIDISILTTALTTIVNDNTNQQVIYLWNQILQLFKSFNSVQQSNMSTIIHSQKAIDNKIEEILERDSSLQEIENRIKDMIEEQQMITDENKNLIHRLLSMKLSKKQKKVIQFEIIKEKIDQIIETEKKEYRELLIQTDLESEDKFIQTDYDSRTIVHKVIQKQILKWKLLEEPILVREHNDNGKEHSVIMQCENGNIAVGGGEYVLYLYNSEYNLINKQDLENWLWNGVTVHDLLYCHIVLSPSIRVFDGSTLDVLKDIAIQGLPVNTMLLITDDLLFLGQDKGFIDVLDLNRGRSQYNGQLKHGNIHDILEINRTDEFAIACNEGLYFGNLRQDNYGFRFTENYDEHYLKDQCVRCIQCVQQNLMIASINGTEKIFVINREQRQIIKEFGNFDGWFNVIDRILNYDDEILPFIIIKDKTNLTVINTKTLQSISQYPCEYQCRLPFPFKQSLIQLEGNGEVIIKTLYYNKDSQDRSLKSFVIATYT